MHPTRKLFAVIPAAGLSWRMGRPKLMLPLGGKTVIRHLLDALDRPEIAGRVVVLRRDDEALAAEVRSAGATVVAPQSPPPDMRSSVQHALDAIRATQTPTDDDGWLLVPADHPLLVADVLAQLIETWNASDAPILIPRCDDRRGHPTFFRWSLADEVATIPCDKGLNELVRWHKNDIREISIEDRSVLYDLDTPEDYEAMQARFQGE
jgi:molybdenum cofactor cytidylyltransferase